MLKRLIATAYIALWCTASTPGGAQAATGFNVYWTTQQAETNLYSSSWGDKHNISTVSCDGASRAKLDAAQEPYFNKFVCQGEYDAEFYGDAFTCTLTVSIRPINATRFILVGGGNPNCLPDQGFVPGN